MEGFLESFKGKRLKLTLKTGVYLGTLQRVTSTRNVVLEDVSDFKTGRNFPGVKLFFGHDIVNVQFAGGTQPEEATAEVAQEQKREQLTSAEFQPYRKMLKLDNIDKNENVDYVVIDEFYEKFCPAVMHIRKQRVIGLGADGVGVFQHERLCWLQIATKNKVYLFDILMLGARAFTSGLARILQDGDVLKVVHDCRGISGCLFFQFGVNLTNVFDTQVADVLHFYSETGGFLPDCVSTLQEVVELHLQMAPSHLESLQIKSQISKEVSEVWYTRPCPTSLLKVMALSVIHLQPLRLSFLDAFMSEYTSLVDAYLDHSRNEAVQIQCIGLSSEMELPQELRMLEQVKDERRKSALNKYCVNEDGLLVRSCPKPEVPDDPEFDDPIAPSESPASPAAVPVREQSPVSSVCEGAWRLPPSSWLHGCMTVSTARSPSDPS